MSKEDLGPDITAHEFSRFARAKSLVFKCQHCGGGNWVVQEETDGRSFSLFALGRDNADIIKSPLAFLLYIYCDNCGNTSSFHRSKIERWLKENPVE